MIIPSYCCLLFIYNLHTKRSVVSREFLKTAMEVQSIFSEKGAKLLVLNNFKFSKAHIAKCGKIRWRCTNTKSRCNAKIYTSADEKTILESQLDHNHEGEKTIARQAISNSVKRKAVEDSTERPSKLIHKELTVSTKISRN